MNRHPQEVTNFMKNHVGSRKVTEETELASFENRYGEKKIIHITRSGLRVKNNRSTVVIELNRKIAVMMGVNIKKRRLELGLTLEDVCIKAGLSSTTPKSRIWEIENSQAKQGLRFGTLYALSIALETTPEKLMPTLEDVLDGAGIISVSETTLRIKP